MSSFSQSDRLCTTPLIRPPLWNVLRAPCKIFRRCRDLSDWPRSYFSGWWHHSLCTETACGRRTEWRPATFVQSPTILVVTIWTPHKEGGGVDTHRQAVLLIPSRSAVELFLKILTTTHVVDFPSAPKYAAFGAECSQHLTCLCVLRSTVGQSIRRTVTAYFSVVNHTGYHRLSMKLPS